MTNPDLLRAVHLLSPAFPIGAFAYSQGLEYAISVGFVTDARSLSDWISAQLAHGAARMDAMFIAQARHGNCGELAELALAFASSFERHREQCELGQAYGAQISALTGQPFPPLPLPVAIGHSMRDLDLPDADILALFLQGFAAQIISVGVRSIPLGQSAGQVILAALAPLILQTAAQAAKAEISDIGTACIGAEMAAMRHETMEIRIYRT